LFCIDYRHSSAVRESAAISLLSDRAQQATQKYL
jgi:hypothetical protein